MSSLIDRVNIYKKHRQAGNHKEILSLCADNITLIDAQGARICGQESFLNYLQKQTPESRWEEPKAVGPKRVELKGQVSKMWMWWNVHIHFDFDDEEKIYSITIYKD